MDQMHGAICLPDGQGGATLEDISGGQVTLAVAGLKALLVKDCPAIERLDLSACTDLSWLAVSECPQLKKIELPSREQGVEIHIDFGSVLPDLHVCGAVRDLDCCWHGGTLAAPRGRLRRGILPGAYVGSSLDMVRRTHGLAMLVNYEGREHCLRLDGPRELTLKDLPVMDIRLGPSVQACEIENLPNLVRLATRGTGLVRVVGCPQLRDVDGHGGILAISDSAANWPLAIFGYWHAATVRASAAFGLSAPQVQHLHAPAHSSGEVTAEAIGNLTVQAKGGDAVAQRILMDWCRKAEDPRGFLFAIQALEALGEGGALPAILWEIRSALHERNRPSSRRSRRNATPWHWFFPRDLADRGWAADLNLWLICHKAGHVVRLGAMGSERHLATIMIALGQARNSDDEALLLALLDEFFAGADPKMAICDASDGKALLMRVVRELITVRKRPCAGSILQNLLTWLKGLKNSDTRLAVLAALHLASCDAATRALVQMSSEPDIETEQRNRALLTAFLPRRSDALAHLASPAPQLGSLL